MADVQLLGLRRVILGKSVCRHSSNGERERNRAHGAQNQTQGGQGERRIDFSGIQPVLADTGCAQHICMSRDAR